MREVKGKKRGEWMDGWMDGRKTYQEHDGDVKEERNHGIHDECDDAGSVDILHRHIRHLQNERDDSIHDRADGGEIVQRDQGVHLELRRAEETLHHDETDGLEDKAGNLVEEAGHDELDFSKRGDDDSYNDEGDVEKHFHVWRRNAQGPRSEEGNDGSGCLLTNIHSC